MKKVLTVIMSLMLVFTLAFSTGCNIGLFMGKYTEVSADELADFAQEVEATEYGEDINYASGVKMSMEMKASYGESEEVKMSMDFKAIERDGDLQMSGDMKTKVKADGEKETIKAEYYYTDGAMYMSMETDDEEQKIKVPMDIDDLVDSMVGEADVEMEFSLIELLETYGNVSYGDTSVKFSMNDRGSKTRIKMELDSEEGDMTMILVYDENKVLIGYKLEAEFNFEGMEMEMKLTIKPWSGKVRLPDDLDTYKGF